MQKYQCLFTLSVEKKVRLREEQSDQKSRIFLIELPFVFLKKIYALSRHFLLILISEIKLDANFDKKEKKT